MRKMERSLNGVEVRATHQIEVRRGRGPKSARSLATLNRGAVLRHSYSYSPLHFSSIALVESLQIGLHAAFTDQREAEDLNNNASSRSQIMTAMQPSYRTSDSSRRSLSTCHPTTSHPLDYLPDLLPNGPKSTGTGCIPQFQDSCWRLRSRNPQGLRTISVISKISCITRTHGNTDLSVQEAQVLWL